MMKSVLEKKPFQIPPYAWRNFKNIIYLIERTEITIFSMDGFQKKIFGVYVLMIHETLRWGVKKNLKNL